MNTCILEQYVNLDYWFCSTELDNVKYIKAIDLRNRFVNRSEKCIFRLKAIIAYCFQSCT